MVALSLQFDPADFGSPGYWNARVAYTTWNRRQAHLFEAGPYPATPSERLEDFHRFLYCRSDSEGFPLALRFAPPLEMEPHWFRFPWLPSGGEAVLTALESEGWVRVWHGAKLEALYSQILCWSLFSSSSAQQGKRFFHRITRGVLADGLHEAQS